MVAGAWVAWLLWEKTILNSTKKLKTFFSGKAKSGTNLFRVFVSKGLVCNEVLHLFVRYFLRRWPLNAVKDCPSRSSKNGHLRQD